MARKYANYKCVYCGTAQATQKGDHIFARGFFLEDRRENLPKAPACVRCGNAKSRLETYLTAVLPFGGLHEDAMRALQEHVPGRLDRNPKLKRSLSSGFQQRAPSGNYELPFNSWALTDLFAEIAVGLLWHHTRLYLPEGYGRIAFLPPDDAIPLLLPLTELDSTHVSGDLGAGTFKYIGHISKEDAPLSIWMFQIMSGFTMRGDPERPDASVSVVAAEIAPQATIELTRKIWLGDRVRRDIDAT